MVFADGRKHELNVSTYQMTILMLFNEADSLSYLDIAEATQIPPADLKRSLQSLACVKVRDGCVDALFHCLLLNTVRC